MPVILAKDSLSSWLESENTDPKTILANLQMQAESSLQYHAVSTKVNSPRYNGADCIASEE